MKFVPLAIPDVILIEPKVIGDSRGFFMEFYREDLFAQNGISLIFIQDNHSRSAKGVLRGLHYQIEPMAQAKLVRVVQGEVYDVAVDIRKGSKTFGKYVGEILSAENKKMLYVPPGFAHGYCSLRDGTEFMYKCSALYSPSHERGLIWNDPSVSIQWPRLDVSYILSEKDKKYPYLKELI